MIEILNHSLKELTGIVLTVLGSMIIVLTVWNKLKDFLLKLVGIFFVIGLALFSDNTSCYFLAILVVATIVTDLGFLQNIAAIIRNSDSYFTYLSSQSSKEIEQKIIKEEEEIEQEIKEEEKNKGSNYSEGTSSIKDNKLKLELDKSNINSMQFGILTEEYTLRYLEQKYSGTLKRYIRLGNNNNRVEFDGILSLEDKDILIEIKSSMRGYVPLNYIRQTIRRNGEKIELIRKDFKRPIEFKLILIGSYSVIDLLELQEIIKKYSLNYSFNISIEVYTFEQIGLNNILGEEHIQS